MRFCGDRASGASTDPAGGAGRPGDDRLVATIDRMRRKLLGEADVRAIRLRRDHQPGRVLVDPVHDSRPRDPADPGKAPTAMMKQRVDQRPVKIARSGMNDQSGLLVDDDQMFVLIHYR